VISPKVSPIEKLLKQIIQLNQRFWPFFVLLSMILTGGGLYLAKNIKLDTDLSRLLPQNSASVEQLKIVQSKAGGSHDLRIVLEGGPLEIRLKAAAEFSDFLSSKPGLVRSVRYKTPKEFLEKYKYHLVPLKSLEAIQSRVQIDPLGLEGDDSSNARRPEDRINDKSSDEELKQAKQLITQLEEMLPYYQTKDERYLAIRIIPEIENLDISKNRKTLKQFEDLVKDFNFTRYHPEIKTAIYGSILQHIERYDSISRDVAFGGWGILLIVILVAFYFQSVWAVLVLVPPLVIGLSVGTALTFLYEHTLNSITIFLVLIVFGMGIEFGIHLWARFLEERRKGEKSLQALLITWQSTGRATITSIAALIAGYSLLTLSSFQGFAQFGRVAIILVSAVALGFLIFMPSWIFMTEYFRSSKPWPKTLMNHFQELKSPAAIARFSFSKILKVSSVVLALAGLTLSIAFLRFDYKFEESITKRSIPKSREALGAIFTERLKPSAVAVFSSQKDSAQFLKFYDDHKADFEDIPLASGLSSFLPEDQDKRIETLKEIGEDVEYSWLKKVEDLQIRDSLRDIKDNASSYSAIQLEEMPAELRDPFIASDGTQDRLIYLYDKGGETDGLKAMKFSAAIDRLKKQSGFDPVLSGQEIIFADVVRRVVGEGPWLVIGMLILVFAICWLDFRELKHALWTVSPVILGFLMTGIVLVLSRLQINFFNMIALASLGSMVVDNSIHLYHRYLENRDSGMKNPSSSAAFFVGPTILLCTCTSILGYGGMLFANHTGVASLGFVAVVGLICCFFSAVVFFPAWLKGSAQ